MSRRRRLRYGVTVVIAVWVRDQGLCQLCGQPVQPAEASLDHVLPRCYGGPSTIANLRVAHQRCNSARGLPRLRSLRGLAA